MILTCPNCSMRYSAKATAIGPAGRKVRCASCEHNWEVTATGEQRASPAPENKQEKPVEEPAPEAVTTEPEPAQEPEPDKPRDPKVAQAIRAKREADRRQQKKRRVMVVWASIAASYFLILTGAWIFRVDVVRLWPKTASVYAAIGGTVNYYGLEITDTVMTRTIRGGSSIIQVQGQVQNITKKTIPVPLIRAEIFDETGASIFAWTIEPERLTLEKDASFAFVSEVRDPPPGKLFLDVGFIEKQTKLPTTKTAPKPVPVAETEDPPGHGH